jgi:hypothetical protein
LKLNIYVEYGDVVSLRNHSKIEDFKEAIDTYFHNYVGPHIAGSNKEVKNKGIPPTAKDIYFFLVIIPDGFSSVHFYNALKNKIN